MVTRKSSTLRSKKLKLKRETVKDLDVRGSNVKGGSGGACQTVAQTRTIQPSVTCSKVGVTC